ncbi:hypothetical protein BDK92_2589 [Micromonospora pisi]|uniref:HTH cro/C1-type domain-containing protein n=1 Tax=Micromonospora pisi TaxID=589240 RepID=A0A495JGW9_9ACTN|nr:hypothetical protein [Micromonospora pisi]RKR88280.1 hypothetical protein BDK92_2589 [Micromonospora pisi]
MTAPISPGALIIGRLKDGRARLGGISTYQLADRLAAMTGGGTKLSANVLQNLEAGRRQQAVTVEEMLLLSLALGVPPEFFLAPPEGDRVQLAPAVVIDSEAFLAWVRGRQPLPLTDSTQYEQVSAEVLGDTGSTTNADLKSEFLRNAAGMLDDFLADSDQIIRQTRGQVRDLLQDLRTAVDGETSREDLLKTIDSYLARLPAS